MNVAIYARVSTDKQAEQGHSLESQIQACTAKAKELGATIIREFVDDGYSGAYLERPKLSELREQLRTGLFQAVVCYDVDRLARNLSHQLLITDDIEKSGAKLFFVNGDYQDTPEGKMFYAIKGAFAGYEREKFRERSMRGRLTMLKKGQVVEDSHVYGYDFDKKNRAYIINPTEAHNVKEIFRLYLDMRLGVPKLTNWLNTHTDIYLPPNKRAWSISTVHDILRREMYTGTFYAHRIYHFKTGLKTEKKVIRPKEEWIEMSCPAIINRETYEEVQQLMNKNKKFSHKPKHHPHLLQGLAYCGKCGHALSVRRGSKNTPRYTCWRQSNVTGSHPGCGAKSMLCEPIDETFWALLENICKSPKKLEAYVKASTPDTPEEYAHALDEQKRQEKLEKIKAERRAVMSWFSQQLLSHTEATERLEALKKAENKLMQQNISVKPKASQIDYRAVCEAVSVCAKNAQTRQGLVRRIIEKVVISRMDNAIGAKNYKLDIQIFFAHQ